MSNKLSLDQLINKKSQIKKVFFYRICGTGMGAAACLLKDAGFDVSGADRTFYPPMSDFLRETKIQLYDMDTVEQEFLKQFDLIVVGNVVPRDSEDAKLIESCGVSFCSFPAALGAFILKEKRVVGCSGTHGKTTTTFILSQLFRAAGHDCGHFIGGVIPGVKPGVLGSSHWFFIESDEYDSSYFEKYSKFRSYCLDEIILTSLEFDHADIFADIESIKDEFRELLKDFKGHLYYQDSYRASCDLVSEFPEIKKTAYGGEKIEILETSPNGTQFKFLCNRKWVSWKTNLVGRHNVENLTSCLLLALHEGLKEDLLREASLKLKMVKRRQEYRGQYGRLIVIDDFAHHPKAIKETISAIKDAYQGRNVIAFFEPNSATSRSNLFQDEFVSSLSLADEVFLTSLNRDTSVKDGVNLNLAAMVSQLNSTQVKTTLFENLNEILEKLNEYKGREDVLLIMSNGTVKGLWESEFVQNLKP